MRKIIKYFMPIILFLNTSMTFSQTPIDEFLKNQPIIDVHIHITRGNPDNEDYNKANSDIDIAKVEWMRQRFDENNIVMALGGGNLKYANMWSAANDRILSGLIFPCSKLSEHNGPCETEFFDETELRKIYQSGNLKSMGESLFNYYGIPPTDKRLEAYWKIAAEFNIPVGIHADTGPPLETINKERNPNYNPDYANPELLKPILKKYPKLKLYLMHYGNEYSDEAIELMKLYPQIYCEISAVSMFVPKQVWEPNVKRLYEVGLGDRLMFGSDFVGTIRKNIEIIYDLDWLTDNQKRDIYYNNAAKFLNLTETEIKKHHEMVD
ncbi:MAG TPA: amidohydrolase family protein [Gillisia sp.]|nr:amidohydrolase family protein [Gillisia sp.]